MATLPPFATYQTLTLVELSESLHQLVGLPHLHDVEERLHHIASQITLLRQSSNPLVTHPDRFRLLIAGSRYASPSLLSKAQQAVERAHAHGWLILVGDAAGVDTAVIAACEAVGCAYICVGLEPRPRSDAFHHVADGGQGYYVQFATEREGDYPARDRYLADLTQRGLCLWNGTSKGTQAVHDYLQQLGKPVHLLTDAPVAASTSAEPASTAELPTVAVVEVVVDTQDITHGEDDAKQFHGTYGLRALDKSGLVLSQKREQLDVTATSNDFAKLHMLATALGALHGNLKGSPARYRLKVVQSSCNIEGWLSKGYKRNTPQVKTLCSTLDDLFRAFPQVEWLKLTRGEVSALVGSIH